MSREAALNPLFLMGKTSTSSLYHSFFLIDIKQQEQQQQQQERNDYNNENINVLFRLPRTRRDIDDIETGVKYFITELTLLKNDNFGSFVITTSASTRYFASYRGSITRLFVAVSICIYICMYICICID